MPPNTLPNAAINNMFSYALLRTLTQKSVQNYYKFLTYANFLQKKLFSFFFLVPKTPKVPKFCTFGFFFVILQPEEEFA